ncbi:MAG: YHS domain-containing protein [Bacteroidetes bacterium]|nr:YHS domain-containing protein [Bacteroidota bacterium]
MKRFLTVVAVVVLTNVAFSQSKVFATNGMAINGYDAVAYFTEGKAVKGSESYSTSWNNSTWVFASKESLDKFKSNPEKYSPQFGGFCAFGVSRGYTVQTDPNAWTIVNDKLYLNYNQQVKDDWMKDRDNLISKAEKNWTELKNK